MIRNWFHRDNAQVRLAVRMTAACFMSYGIGLVLGLQQNQWAVLTSIIVMQASVGASLKAMLDRFIGSLGGAIAGVIITVGLHHAGVTSAGIALVLGLPALTLLAAIRPAYRVTPITFIILILTPNLQELGPILSAYERMLEIGVGSLVALGVSLFVLPARAHDSLVHAVAQVLSAMADLVTLLPGGMHKQADLAAIEATHARIRSGIGIAEVAADEAVRERRTHLSDEVDPLPICRTLRRLRHDIAIIGRTITTPLPAPVTATLNRPILEVFDGIARYLRGTGEAFAERAPPPQIEALEASFAARSEAARAIRQQGITRALADDDLARIFGLGFALEQLHRDLRDLSERGKEFANRQRD